MLQGLETFVAGYVHSILVLKRSSALWPGGPRGQFVRNFTSEDTSNQQDSALQISKQQESIRIIGAIRMCEARPEITGFEVTDGHSANRH